MQSLGRLMQRYPGLRQRLRRPTQMMQRAKRLTQRLHRGCVEMTLAKEEALRNFRGADWELRGRCRAA